MRNWKFQWMMVFCLMAFADVALASDPTLMIIYFFSLPLAVLSLVALFTTFTNPKAGMKFSGALFAVHIFLSMLFSANLYAGDLFGVSGQMMISMVFIIISFIVGVFKVDSTKVEKD